MPRLFVDNLTVIDCSVLDPERGLIGASWAVDVELSGELDKQSMVFDFAKVKKTLKRVIDVEVDHKLLVPLDYRGTDLQPGPQIKIHFVDQQGLSVKHSSPTSAICLIDAERISRKVLIRYLTTKLMEQLPANVEQLKLVLREEKGKGPFYTYSHGLKKHDGNCQRIAHGHRSTIRVWKDGQRKRSLEKKIARNWSDIYLGSKEDVLHQDDQFIHFAYSTDQGEFSLELPIERVHIMDCDSTVECIAEHLVAKLKAEKPPSQFKVKAFEGINKGAIATR